MDLKRALVGKSFGRTLIRGFALAASILAVAKTLAVPVRATGISMQPTYHEGQLLFFNTLAYRWAEPHRGDIAAITFEDGRAVLVKRVIALPGERVRIEGGVVFVNDVPLEERYVTNRSAWQISEFDLEADEYLVIGDNRGMSALNHTFGVVTRGDFFGKLVF